MNHWTQHKLNALHQETLREHAELERLAQEARQEEQPRRARSRRTPLNK